MIEVEFPYSMNEEERETETTHTSKIHRRLEIFVHMDVSENSGTPKSSILIGFSIINHPFWSIPIFGNTHTYIYI